jgi:putative nucleotidyltransferase with HDIG domain
MSAVVHAPSALFDLVAHDLSRGTSDLPQLARSAAEALRLARAADLDIDAAVKLAENDPPLAARVLAVANSALYARGARHVSPRRAIAHIGGSAVREVLYQSAYASMIVDVPRFADQIARDFVHGVATAALARALARVASADPEDAFLGGLLHDLGRARCWKIVAKRLPSAGGDEHVHEIVDALHASAGHALVRTWQLPAEIADVCLHHHAPEGRRLPAIVAAADVLAHAAEGRPETRTAEEVLVAIGIDAELSAEWLARGKAEVERAQLMTRG